MIIASSPPDNGFALNSITRTSTGVRSASESDSSIHRRLVSGLARATFFLYLLFVLSVVGRGTTPTPRSTPTPTPTPTVKVSCPPNVTAGNTVEFNAKIISQMPGTTPTYSWTVIPRTRTPSNVTDSKITIETDSTMTGVNATVTVDGLGSGIPPQTVESCVVVINRAVRAAKLSELYEDPADVDVKERGDEVVAQRNDDDYVYLVTHDKQGTIAALREEGRWMLGIEPEAPLPADGYYQENEARGPSDQQLSVEPRMIGSSNQIDTPAMRLAKKLQSYLVSKGVPEDHILISRGEPRLQVTVEIYLGPKGALLPSNVVNGGPPLVREEQIEVSWDVLPQSIVGDNFGKHVRKRYYVIQVVISNNSGADFQLLSMGFSLSAAMAGTGVGRSSPSTDYRLVRGTILNEKDTGTRNRTLSVITSTGLLSTSFVPFFKVDSHRASFSQFINIFTNPFRAGFEIFFPDQTIEHLTRLDEFAWRDGAVTITSIPNNSRFRTYVFFPKDLLGLNKTDRDNPLKVKQDLSSLVLIGSATQQIKSITKTQP